jgi:hypothetical protein
LTEAAREWQRAPRDHYADVVFNVTSQLVNRSEGDAMESAHRYLVLAVVCALLGVGCSARCHKKPCSSGGVTSGVPSQGIIWLNHQDLVLDNAGRIRLGTNGTDVFVDTNPGITFPDQEFLPIYVPTLPPGYYVTGMRVCYAIVGDNAATKVHRLRLSQFDGSRTGPRAAAGLYPGYIVRLEDSSAGNAAPIPPAGGFAFDDGKGFVCVDSATAGQPCLDQGKGTISADTGVQFGDATDRIVIEAIGVHYDTTCTPN